MADNEVGRTTEAELKYTDTVEILVGPGKKRFCVHTHVLNKESPFFKAASSDRWSNSSSAVIEPPDDLPRIFEIYVNCLYTGNVDAGDTRHNLEEETCTRGTSRFAERLVRAYVLADKIGDVRTANKIIDAIIQHSDDIHKIPPTAGIVSANTPPNSPLRRLFVDYFVHETSNVAYIVNSDCVTKAFLGDVLTEIHRLTQLARSKNSVKDFFDRTFTRSHKCRYHQHAASHPICGDQCEKKSESEDGEKISG